MVLSLFIYPLVGNLPRSAVVKYWRNNNFLFGSRLCLRVQKMRAEIIMRGRADWNVEPTNEHGEMTKTFW